MISRRTTIMVSNIISNYFTKTITNAGGYGHIRRGSGRSEKVDTEKLREFLFEFNVEGYTIEQLCKDYHTKKYLKEAIMNLHTGIFYSRKEYKKCQKIGQSDLKNIIIGIISKNIQSESREALENLLRIDGYIYADEHLYEINVDIDDKINLIKSIIKKFDFSNLKEFDVFYKNMNTDFENSKWEDSINNSRRLYELVLKECAEYYSNNIEKDKKNFDNLQAVEVRKYLDDVEFFSEDEINIIRYFYAYMSNKGSHIKLALEEQADFSRVISINIILYSLRRLESYIN